ncbi:hypothetical protein PINS_up004688 [Pythium insidiosum]|nr:hypothetical protein PINS_up004688 [Pythium insidiosum]
MNSEDPPAPPAAAEAGPAPAATEQASSSDRVTCTFCNKDFKDEHVRDKHVRTSKKCIRQRDQASVDAYKIELSKRRKETHKKHNAKRRKTQVEETKEATSEEATVEPAPAPVSPPVETCPVCLEQLSDDPALLICGHKFHQLSRTYIRRLQDRLVAVIAHFERQRLSIERRVRGRTRLSAATTLDPLPEDLVDDTLSARVIIDGTEVRIEQVNVQPAPVVGCPICRREVFEAPEL